MLPPTGDPHATVGSVVEGPGYVAEPAAAERAPGTIVAGDYRVESRLGLGGMGVVYLARHMTLGREVAIKELLSLNPEGRERLIREAMAMAMLDHPNVVRVFDARQVEGQVFIAMEYLPAGTLQQWCSQRRRTVRQIVSVFAGAAEGLMAAHAQGIVHRDFKPQNVLMTQDGRPKVADFGIARAVARPESPPGAAPGRPPEDSQGLLDSDLTRTGSMMGTPAYMAPEQYEGKADARSDQFAFCVTLYEALYGKRPFSGTGPGQLWLQTSQGRIEPPPRGTDVPAEVFEVLSRGLAPDPAQRWPSLSTLMQAMRGATKSKTPLIAALVGTGLAAVAAVSAVTWWQLRPPEPLMVDLQFIGIGIPDVPDRSDEWVMSDSKSDVPPEEDEPTRLTVKMLPMRSFDGDAAKISETYVCDGSTSYKNAKWEFEGEGPFIIARDGCDFRCTDCEVEAKQLLVAHTNGRVEFRGGVLTVWENIATVRNRGEVVLSKVTLEATGTDPAFLLEDEGRLSLEKMDVAARSCIDLREEATVRLDEVTLLGQHTIRAEPDTVVQKRRTSFLGKKSIEGTVETIRRTAAGPADGAE